MEPSPGIGFIICDSIIAARKFWSRLRVERVLDAPLVCVECALTRVRVAYRPDSENPRKRI